MPVAWEEAFEGFEPEEKGGGKGGGTGNGHAKPLRFQIKPFEAIKLSTEPSYRVKGILPRVGLVVVWGPPKCGKSFWTFDTIMHIALGWQYRGRKVQQGRVVYLALEGGPGFARRVEAWRRRHLADHDGLVPFSLIDVPVDLVADHKALISDIEAQVNEPPAVVVIDTLNRSLAGSENKPEDMAKYIRAADTIRARFNCLVIIIHHCGVEGSRPRGHTSLTGADDAQIAVYRDKAGNITVTVEFMKDGEASAPMGSKLEIVELGYDDDGDQMSSCIIVPTAVVDNKARTLPDGAKVALDQLQELIADIGEIPPASNHIPPNTKACSAAIWREHFYNTHPGKPDTKQKAFVRAATTLQKARLIGIWQDNVWLAGHAGHSRTSKDMSGERIEPDMAAAVPVAEEAGRTDRTPTLNGCPVSGSHVRRRLSEQMSVQSGGNADGTPKAAEEDTSQARGLKPVHSSPDVMPRRRRRNRMQQWLDHVEAGDDQEGELILAMRKDPDMREFETLDEMAKYLGSVKAKFYGDLVSFENLTATLPGIWQRYQEWERGRGTDNR